MAVLDAVELERHGSASPYPGNLYVDPVGEILGVCVRGVLFLLVYLYTYLRDRYYFSAQFSTVGFGRFSAEGSRGP